MSHNYVRRELVDRYGDVLTPEAQATVTDGSWDDALSTVAGIRRTPASSTPTTPWPTRRSRCTSPSTRPTCSSGR